jgi:hypothetical protein
MNKGRDKIIDKTYRVYYGMSRQELLNLLYIENSGIIGKLDKKVFEGLTKSSTQYNIDSVVKSLNTQHCHPVREYDAGC